jgi:acyl dehydratase
MSAMALPDVGAKFGPWPLGPFDKAALARYAKASRDLNPLHLDTALARRIGLADVPVHGMLLMGVIEPALAAWRNDLRLQRLAAKFLRPVLPGEAVILSARVARRTEDTLLLRLTAAAATGALALVGEATLVPREG